MKFIPSSAINRSMVTSSGLLRKGVCLKSPSGEATKHQFNKSWSTKGQGYVALVEATLKLHVTASTFKPYIWAAMYICPGIHQWVKWCFFYPWHLGKYPGRKATETCSASPRKKTSRRGPAPSWPLCFWRVFFPPKQGQPSNQNRGHQREWVTTRNKKKSKEHSRSPSFFASPCRWNGEPLRCP